MKRLLLWPLHVPRIPKVLSVVTGMHASIFMLHRFSAPELGVVGHPPGTIRRILARLRRERFDLISLEELFRRLREGEPLNGAVAFTLDDGYLDQASVAAPIFAEFDCPMTIFAVSGFLDGSIWLWWDQIRYIFERTRRTELRMHLACSEVIYRCDSVDSRRANWRDASFRCQDALHTDRAACIADLSRAADVELPATPPLAFAPLSWDQARGLEKRGTSFGPHTVTHPVLTSTSEEHAEWEIRESWKRMVAELIRPVPVFCYPHGRPCDYSEREMAVVQQAGLWGGVSGHPGELRAAEYHSAPAICRVPRFPFQDHLLDILQCVSGLEILKARVRTAVG